MYKYYETEEVTCYFLLLRYEVMNIIFLSIWSYEHNFSFVKRNKINMIYQLPMLLLIGNLHEVVTFHRFFFWQTTFHRFKTCAFSCLFFFFSSLVVVFSLFIFFAAMLLFNTSHRHLTTLFLKLFSLSLLLFIFWKFPPIHQESLIEK